MLKGKAIYYFIPFILCSLISVESNAMSFFKPVYQAIDGSIFDLSLLVEKWDYLKANSESFNWLINVLQYPVFFIAIVQLIMLTMLVFKKKMEIVYMVLLTDLIICVFIFLLFILLIN